MRIGKRFIEKVKSPSNVLGIPTEENSFNACALCIFSKGVNIMVQVDDAGRIIWQEKRFSPCELCEGQALEAEMKGGYPRLTGGA